MSEFVKAYELIKGIKGDSYTHGFGVLPLAGGVTATLGKRALLVRDHFPGADGFVAVL